MVFIPVVPSESHPPSPQVQDLANQVADVLRRSETQYPGLSTRDVLDAVALAIRQARPGVTPRSPKVALALGAMAATLAAGLVVWRSSGGSLSPVGIAAIAAVVLAVISIARRVSE